MWRRVGREKYIELLTGRSGGGGGHRPMVNRGKLGVELSRVELKWSMRFILYEGTTLRKCVLDIQGAQ